MHSRPIKPARKRPSKACLSYILNRPKPLKPRLSSISMENQQLLVRIARLEYENAKTAFTNLPSTFIVPDEEPWPASLRGATLDVSAFRIGYKKQKLDAGVVAALDEIKFVWDLSGHKWRLNRLALETYKSIHGDLLVPQSFVVPTNDNTHWPVEVWGMQLGRVVGTLRRSVDTMPSDRRDELDALGFVWDGLRMKLSWEDKLAALTTYRSIHRHVKVPISFTVPSVSPWPESTWSMALGNVVHRLRVAADTLPVDRRAKLDELGFVWEGLRMAMTWDDKLNALRTFKQLHGHLLVPRVFQVPMDDMKWPHETWGIQLGVLVNNLRTRAQDMPSTRREQLDALGFVWNTVEQ
ncbi:hypothetical protein Ae201684P_004756 [Aphanomyces euteiches]|uniref:Helicase-associated domain-containing protein n=1 Tax=Aphanomyces euteiches TaxID=100861 RepID=A0A6G0XC89_9STRA|nr:hypothetical protein Ae201684_006238 [Aphanomyces euteiches]KAH9069061.1 hypothetical protein Ae201684P_004756 [Aphanomyces euteiches]KAH9155628.1 hypothetical protein AeRB84_002412 [Aphanomyces euteiches]